MNMTYYREKVRGQYSIHTKFPCWRLLGCKPQGRYMGTSPIFLHPSFDYPGYLMVRQTLLSECGGGGGSNNYKKAAPSRATASPMPLLALTYNNGKTYKHVQPWTS